jgi:hypothetical protein
MTTQRIASTTAYLLLNLVIGIFWFSLLVPLLATSIGLVIVWAGIPLLALTLALTRGAATMERARVRSALGIEIPSPYREPVSGGLATRARARLTDRAVWRDLAYLLLLLPIGIIEFALLIGLWSAALALVALPIQIYFLPVDIVIAHVWVIDSFLSALPVVPLGVLLGLFTLSVTRRLGRGHGRLAAALLGPTLNTKLAAETERLQASRTRRRGGRSRSTCRSTSSRVRRQRWRARRTSPSGRR